MDRRIFVTAAALVWAAACGGDDGDGIEYTGTPATFVAADFDGWVPSVQARIDGSDEKPFLTDTGAPLTIIDAPAFPGRADGKANDEIQAFALTFPDYQTATWNVFNGDGPAGLIGGDLLRHFAYSLDYHDGLVWLSDPFDPTVRPQVLSTGEEADIPMEVLGGGLSLLPGCGGNCGTIALPATRVIVRATFEGHEPVWALVDSGASAVVLDSTLFDELGDAARPRLDGVNVGTVEGIVDGFLSRVWRVRVHDEADDAGIAVDDVPILVVPGSALLAGLSAEVNRDVKALIGGTVLREFWTTFDYQEETLRLARYSDRSHIPPNEYVGVGFNILQMGDDWVIVDVYTSTDAWAQGLLEGDVVEELGGTVITGQPASVVADVIDNYSLGQQVPVGIRGLSGTEEHMVLVEDLLPSYPPPP